MTGMAITTGAPLEPRYSRLRRKIPPIIRWRVDDLPLQQEFHRG